MISEIIRKIFRLGPYQCETCAVLRDSLEHSEGERRDLLRRLLERDKPEHVPVIPTEELKPIQPQYTPWRVRQQMLEAEDREKARILKDRQKEIDELEKEVGIHAAQ